MGKDVVINTRQEIDTLSEPLSLCIERLRIGPS